MLQNLLSLNSAPSMSAVKSQAPSAQAEGQGGFGRALRDAGYSQTNNANGGSAGGANHSHADPMNRSASDATAASAHDKLNRKQSGPGDGSDEIRSNSSDSRADATEDNSTADTQEAAQIGLQSIDGMVLANDGNGIRNAGLANGTGLEGPALMRTLQSGLGASTGLAGEALPAKNEIGLGQNVPGVASVLPGEIQLGAKGGGLTVAELAVGSLPGVALQVGAAGLKSDGRNPLDKSNNTLPGLANMLKEGGNIDAATKELPRNELNGLRVASAAEETMQRANSDPGTFKDGGSLLLAGKAGADTGAVKSVNELALGNLTSTSQTLVNAVKENSNWSKMLSAPTVNFTETMRPNGKMLQALSVTLDPVELGKLELNLRMQQGQVTIDVRTESDQAYRTLLVDQDALVNTLRSLGFKVDGININGPQSENSAQFQNPGQSDNKAMGEGASGEASRGNDSYSDEASVGTNDGAIVDEEDPASLNVI